MNTRIDTVRVPDHKIIGVLGQGGMARVYLARDEAFDRLVAIKVIDARFAGDEQFHRRFEREAKTAGGLSHPNIVPVHRYGITEDGRPFLTMAYLEGGSLRERMRKRGAMSVDEALGIARQIASALLAAHTRSIVHRDLKPDNVLFQGETAYLTDFGIAKLLNAATELTGTGLNPGTVRYFSPEQAQEQAVDARSDIYALGILIYEMLTGRQPIEGDTIVQMIMRIVNTSPQPLPEGLRGLQPFMDIMLAKDPADRLGSCQEVVAIIDAMLRNWTRYADVDRLTDGIMMQPSGRATPTVDLDAEVPLVPPEQLDERAESPPGERSHLPEEDLSGLTDLGQSLHADRGPLPANLAVAAGAEDPTIVQHDGERMQMRAATSLVTRIKGSRAWPTIALIAAFALVCTLIWLQRTGQPERDDLAEPASGSPEAAAVAVSRPATAITPSAGQGLSRPSRPTLPDSANVATLVLVVSPQDASITLIGVPERYTPGVTLKPGDLRVRIEHEGFVALEEQLHLRAGANNFNRRLTPAPSAVVAQRSEPIVALPAPGGPARHREPARRPGERFHDMLATGEPGPDLVVIPGGSFHMGGDGPEDAPAGNATVSSAFATGVYEVTFEDYDRFAVAERREAPTDQGWGRGRRPVVNVSWNDAQAYAAWLSKQTGYRYRLLSESEWEWAHRAGTTTVYNFGDTLRPGMANCDGCGPGSARRTVEVGSFARNRFGLYDTHGNVWEWVDACFVQPRGDSSSRSNLRASGACRQRISRGGSWYFDALSMRSSRRAVFAPTHAGRDVGFRVASDL